MALLSMGSSVLVDISRIPRWTVNVGHIPQGTHLGLTWEIDMKHLTLPKWRFGRDSTQNMKVFLFLKNKICIYIYIYDIHIYIIQISNFDYGQSG